MAGVLAIALTGCVSDAFVAEEMERALTASNVAIALGLVAAEILSHTHDTPDTQLRHPGGTEYGCPGVLDWQGTTDSFFVTLDYATQGCYPDSALVPTLISGHAGLSWSAPESEATWDVIYVGTENAVGGTLTGPVEMVGTDVVLIAQGTLIVGPSQADMNLGAEITDAGITLGGDVTVLDAGSDLVHLEGLFFGPDDIVPPCPTPDTGLARLEGDGEEVVVDFTTPGNGVVKVERARRVSEDVSLCDYRSDVF